MRAIFISYRRDDTEGHAGRLFEDLVNAFGSDAVFMDVAGIAPGRDFRKVIDEHTAACCVLLAMIGRTWVTAVDEHGRRRLDDPMDFVRLETASALKRDIAVIPVLVQGMRMPKPEELPEDLKDLAFRNGVELTHARWDSDVEVLIDALRPLVQGAAAKAGADPKAQQPQRVDPSPQTLASIAAPTTPAPTRRRVAWIVAVALAATGIGVAGYLVMEDRRVARVEEARKLEAEREAEAARTAQAEAQAAEQVAQARREEQARAAAAAEQARKAAQAERAAAEERAAEEARKAAELRYAEAQRAAEERRQRAAVTAAEEARAAELKHAEATVRRDAEQRAAEAERALEGRRQRAAAAAAEEARPSTGRTRSDARDAGQCIDGYVWRMATRSDQVCVTPEVRRETAAENELAASRKEPSGGPYGPDTCRQGYVWREAFSGDHVCVPPASRSRAAADNANASALVAR